MTVGEDGQTLIEEVTRGDAVREVLEYSDYDTDELRESITRRLSERKELGLISDDDEHEVLATFSRVLDDYTYLE